MPASVTESSDLTVSAEDLCREFLAISDRKRTGTLLITTADERTRCFLCQGGTISDIDPGTEDSFLVSAILATGRISSRAVKKAEKTAERTGARLGDVLLEIEPIPEDELLAAIEEGIAGEVTAAFDQPVVECAFVEHDPDERVEGFQSELSEYFDLLADPESLFLEAAQRLDRWDLVRSGLDLLLDVFYATPGTFAYFREPDSFPREIRLLGAVDGVKDVEEVIGESDLDPFEAIEIIRGLIRAQAIELINPVQMFQLGAQIAEGGHFEKAVRLFRRARDRGLDDFDIDLRIAQCLEASNFREEAADAYEAFANKCVSQVRMPDAIQSLKKVVKLVPRRIDTTRRLLDLLVEHKLGDEALETGMALADRLVDAGNLQSAVEVLVGLRAANDKEVGLHERIIELAQRMGDHDLVREEKELIARAFCLRRDTAEALEAYQSMFCEGNDSLEVRLKLVELHREQGNRLKAAEHVTAILRLGGRRKVKDPETIRSLHRTMVELEPGNVRSNRWLIEHGLEEGRVEETVERLRAWLPELENAQEYEELVTALQKLISLEDRFEHRWSLASVLETVGRDTDAQRELQSLAREAIRRRELDHASKALDHLLKKDPLNPETRRAQVELLDSRGEKRAAAEKLKELATLEIIAGNIQAAEGYCRQFLIIEPEDAEVVDKLARLCLELGDRRKGVEQHLKAVKIHLERRDLGQARTALDRLLETAPQHPEGIALRGELESLETALEGPRGQSDAAAGATASARAREAARRTAEGETASASTSDSARNPAAASATSGAERDPFQNHAPVKTTVSGITARLRKLRSGGAAAPTVSATPGDAPDPPPKETTPGGAEEEVPPGASAAPAAPLKDGPHVAGGPSPGGIAARLRALSAAKNPPGTRESAARSAASEPTRFEPEALRSVAARLKALSSGAAQTAGGDATSPPKEPPDAPEPPGAKADETAAGADEAGCDDAAKRPALANVQVDLGASASRLAALRKAST